MKRWQTRGEVQDSDEEELGLETNSHSIEYPSKRAKVAEASTGSNKDGDQARTTQGTLLDREQVESIAHNDDATEAEKPGSSDALSPVGSFATREDDNEPGWTTRTNAKTYGRLQRVPRQDAGKAREVFPVVTQAEQNAVDVANMHTVFDVPSSSNPTQDDVVAQQEKAAISQMARPTTPSTENLPAANLMSVASSPLSELSNPPDSPPASLRFMASTQLHPQVESQLPAVSHIEEAFELVDHDLRTALLTQGTRRSLRARQEKQLHPYMYDKAQYQQQCRERGLRPVRLLEQTAHDTQDASLNHDQDPPSSSATRPSTSSSSLGGLLSSAVALEDSFGGEPQQLEPFDAEDDLPDMDRLMQSRAVVGRLHSRKRQKITHSASRGGMVAQSEHRTESEDVFGVPPSPPTSSRGSVPRTAMAPKGFRLPHGMSPKPLPTPQISSDLRPSHGNQATPLSDEDTPPRTLRRIARVRSAVTIGSDSSAESESGSADDQKLLSRERRRIRGVLPASWLNIDRKAQPARNPAGLGHYEHDSTIPLAAPQKGVARKIQRRSTAALGLSVLEISDEDEAEALDDSTPTVTSRMPPTATINPEGAIRPDDDVDVDDMEVDWFDPMLAGASRVRHSPKSNGKRQSRITGTSRKQSMLDFSEERIGLRHHRGADVPKQRSAGRKVKAKTRQRKRPPHLGILDAPRSPAGRGSVEPQFVRLAARQARQAPGQGRHSPSRKVIRLATREDTEQANSALQNWKRGTIPRRPSPETGLSNTVDKTRGLAHPSPRTPLTDVTDHSHNTTITHSVPPKLTSNPVHGNATLTQPPPHSKGARPHASERLPPQHPQDASTGNNSCRRSVQKKTALRTAHYRNAQLETHESAYIQQNRSAGFHRRIQCLTEAVARRSSTPIGEVQMERFLQDSGPVPRANHNPSPDLDQGRDSAQTRSVDSVPKRLPHRPRKRRTQRLDVDTRQYRQPSEPLPDFINSHNLDEVPPADSELVLRGLGPSGTRYATDFDISRLPQDTYFANSTFIGSGKLASALALDSRDLGHGFGSLRIFIGGNAHEWNTWSEEVSTAMAAIPDAISIALGAVDGVSSSQYTENIDTVTSNVDHMLHSTIRYLSKCLRFPDAVDSKACCNRLDQVVQDLLEITDESDKWALGLLGLRQRILQSALVLARQNQIIGDHVAVPHSIRATVRDRVLRVASRLASHLIPGYLDELRSGYEEQRVSSVRELGVRRDDSVLAGVVTLHHCVRGDHNPRPVFWDIIEKALGVDPSKMLAAPEIDATWYSIVTILPCLDFDSAGIIQSSRNRIPESDWSLPTRLIERCLSLYEATCAIRGSSINEYVRATLARCSHLFTMWRWWKCDTLLSTLYDFFARRNLSLLYREEGRGSPDFLENLTSPEDISLDVESDDRSFSIFLKLLAASLRIWRQYGVYSDKKIGGIAWRIIPNHARIYRKDSEVKQADLDALRNHLDLLCTLYFASPPSHRLRVDMLRNLVDHATSHREACRISVRAWSRLASFQMSTNESTENLESFIDWFKDMALTTVAQYRFARTEAEQQYAEAKTAGVSGLSDEMLETTIASNQRQIAATLVDLLAAFRRALTSASGVKAAHVLLEGCEPWKMVDSFDPSERRLTTVFKEALDLFRVAVDVQWRFQSAPDSQAQSEDSQDYGDFSILQEFATGQVTNSEGGVSDVVATMQDAFAQILSNAFGSEIAPDDFLLAKLLDIWVQSANHLVGKGVRSWSNFIDDYNAGAWFQLRDTAQHRKFTPYVLAKVLEADPEAFDGLKAAFMSAWLKYLVERESTLKYQHLLTAALLNVSSEEPMLQNLPFSRTSSSAEYRITLPELRQRRLGVISSVFSNMLQYYNTTMLDRPQALPELGRCYADLFRQLMQAMKSNYQDLQLSHSNGTADSTVQGAYVLFVQEVVGFLQQYAIEGICTVDRFFLDSSAFPLPTNDPTYVVGKLKKHVSKLAEARTRKRLATFIHNISERAALDQQQAYLTDQMHRAMSGTMESGETSTPSLRHVLLTSIIPAYLDNVIDDNVTWILALPMIEASRKTVSDLLYDTNFESEDGVVAAIEQVGTLLSSVQKSFARLAVDRQRLKLPHVVKTAAAMLNLCHATVVFANHIQRVTKQATVVVRQLRTLQDQANRIEEQLSTPDDFFDLIMDDTEDDRPPLRWPDTYEFSERHVKQSMASDWSVVDERYFVKRGNGSREVNVQVDGYAEERDGLLQAIDNFRSIRRRQATRGRRSKGVEGNAFGIDGLMI